MKTAIAFHSTHHGNTRKLVEAIAEKHDVKLIDLAAGADGDLSEYDRIGVASGVYGGGLARELVAFADERLPEGKEVFYLYTSSITKESALKQVRKIAADRGCREVGAYYSKGYDTFGPFKLVGGVGKGHPTEDEICGAVAFYDGLDG